MLKKRELRHRFPVTKNFIYLNHAAVGSLGRHSYEAMEALARDQRDFGAIHWREWLSSYSRLRREAAALIGADPSEISLLKNTTEGLSFVANGLAWRAGDNVVTTDMEFPSNFFPWKGLERRGVECREVANRDGAFTVADLEPLIDARTRLVALSAVSFHNGFRCDLEAIGELCESRGVLFCVDGIQALGALPVDVRRAKVTFLAADGHKWMLGPEGAAIFYCAAEARHVLTPLETGWMSVRRGGTSIGAPMELHEDGRRFESGAINTSGVCGLEASLAFINACGIGEVAGEVIRLANHAAKGLESVGFTVRSPQPARSGIVSATVPESLDVAKLRRDLRGSSELGLEPSKPVQLLHLWLESNGVICSAREGMLRLSPHFYNDDAELDALVEMLGSVV